MKAIKPPVEKHRVRIAVAKQLAESIASKKLAELSSQGFEALLPVADQILAAVRHAEIYGRHWQDNSVDLPVSELKNLDAFDKVALQGMTASEVAKELGASNSTVTTRVYKAIHHLMEIDPPIDFPDDEEYPSVHSIRKDSADWVRRSGLWRDHLLKIVDVPQGWDAAHDALLGTEADSYIARKLNVDVRLVAKRRTKLGIEPTGYDRYTWERDQLLGKVSDEELAKKFNVSTITIAKHRSYLGIPPYKKSA